MCDAYATPVFRKGLNYAANFKARRYSGVGWFHAAEEDTSPAPEAARLHNSSRQTKKLRVISETPISPEIYVPQKEDQAVLVG